MELRRAIGTGGLTALGVNAIVGSGIFFLPGLMAANVGPASLVAVFLAAATAGAIAQSYAEVGSHFSETGGALLYSQRVYGQTVGFAVGWLQWLARLATWAAVANAVGVAIGDLAKTAGYAGHGWVKPVAVLAVLTAVTWANLRGVRQGVWVSTILTTLKVATLLAFVLFGFAFVSADNFVPFAPKGYGQLGDATLLIFYAFAGFEGLCVPSGEMKNPQQTLLRGLLLTMLIVGVVYFGVIFVTLGINGANTGGETAVLDAAQQMFGQGGRIGMSVAILISLLGINAAMALITPRCLLALAEQGMLPNRLARVNEQHATPDTAILLSALIVGLLATSGTFGELAALSVVGRFMQYIPTCAALLVIRYGKHKEPPGDADGIRVPFAGVVAVVAILLSLWIVSKASAAQWAQTLLATAVGFPLYWITRRVQRGADSKRA